MSRIRGLRGALAVVHCDAAGRPGVEARARVLAAAWSRAFGRPVHERWSWTGDVGVWSACDGPLEDAPVWVWGAPIAGGADLDAAAARRLLDEPARGRGVRGLWVVAGEHDGGIRCVTSPSAVRTLARAAQGGRSVVATRSIAALALAGAPLRLARDRIVEQVAFDFPLGDGELLDGARVLEEAALVDVSPRGLEVRSWWPREQRLGPGAPTTPGDVRIALGAEVAQLAGHLDVAFGLTAGKDSGLLVDAAVDRGVQLPSFTFGWAGMPDADGASAIAAEVGFPHTVVGGDRTGTLELDVVVANASWSEGVVNPRAHAVKGLEMGPGERLWVTGHGGEIGRAYYWPEDPAKLARPAAALATRLLALPAEQTALLTAAVQRVLDACAALRPGDVHGALDLFYVLARMHRWPDRIPPMEQFRAVLPVFLAPDVVRALLDLPEADRRSGTAFLPGEEPAPAARKRPLWPAVRRRIVRRALVPTPTASPEWDVLAPALRESAERGSVCREVLGEEWWLATTGAGPYPDWARLHLSNALAIDALAFALPDLDRALEAAR